MNHEFKPGDLVYYKLNSDTLMIISKNFIYTDYFYCLSQQDLKTYEVYGKNLIPVIENKI